MTSNQFDLLGDVDNDDPSQLLAAAAAKKAAEPKPAAPAAAKPASTNPCHTHEHCCAPSRDGHLIHPYP